MSLELSKKAIQVKPSSTLAITAKAKEMKASGIDVIGFGAGEPDFNTPDNICEAACKAIKEGFTKYTPASGTNELKEAISNKFKKFNDLDYGINQIVVSNGGKHSLTNIFQAIINPGDEVIIPAPYWLTYPEIVKLVDGVPVIVETSKNTGFKLTPKQLSDAITPKTKALILNTPSNPTGMIYSRDELTEIAKIVVDNDIYVVADEMYENLTYNGLNHVSIASLGEDIYKHTITCSGLSKAFSMTGWRIGYTGSSVEIAKVMGSVQSHETSNPNSVAQKAALEALNGPWTDVDSMKEAFDRRRKLMFDRLSQMPYIEFIEPEGAFYYFVDFGDVIGKSLNGKTIDSTIDIGQILLEDYHIAVVPCPDFGFPTYIRFSYAISDEMINKGMDRLEKFLGDIN